MRAPSRADRAVQVLALLAVLGALLAGCGAPKAPPQEILGSTGLVFPARPTGTVDHVDIVWDVGVLNTDNTTSASAQLHLSIKSSRSGLATERSASIEAVAPHASRHIAVRTPYDGPGDYSGVAEIVIGSEVRERAFLFFEQCPVLAAGQGAAVC